MTRYYYARQTLIGPGQWVPTAWLHDMEPDQYCMQEGSDSTEESGLTKVSPGSAEELDDE